MFVSLITVLNGGHLQATMVLSCNGQYGINIPFQLLEYKNLQLFTEIWMIEWEISIFMAFW